MAAHDRLSSGHQRAVLQSHRVSRLSPSPSDTGDGRSTSPSGASLRSFASSSTLDSMTYDGAAPPLPVVIAVRECVLRKRPPTAPGPGWGFVLRGTTSEYAEGTKVHTCHIESIHEDGTAKSAGLQEQDQILCIDRVQVKSLEHSDVVKMFQMRDKVSLIILPAFYRTSVQARITRFNATSLGYFWAMMRHLHSLEIINVDLDDDRDSPETGNSRQVDVGYLLSLRSLSICHCSLKSLTLLEGLKRLQKLESLSLANNFLTADVLGKESAISALLQLRSLNLSRNLLNRIPEVILKMSSLEMLVLVDNNISQIPIGIARLKRLHTLCMDGNLLQEVDKALSVMPALQKFTVANNSLECEPQALKLKEYLVTSVQYNPYTTPDESGMVSRHEPSLRRTVSVRGNVYSSRNQSMKRHSLDWERRDFDTSDITSSACF